MRYYLIIFNLCVAGAALQAQVCQTQGNMIQSVSVECHGADCGTMITWVVPDTLPDNAAGYVIYEYLGGNQCMRELVRINDPRVTACFVNGMAAKGYTMAVSTSEEDRPITQQHKPPVISAVDFNSCDYTATIRWTPYTGWDVNHTEYAVYARVGAASTYTLLTEHIADTSFVWMDAPTREPLSILVQAVNTSALATSKAQPWEGSFDFPHLPDYIHLAAVDYADGKAALAFTIDPATELAAFEVQRSAGASFTAVTSFSDKTLVEYVDEPGATAYAYRIVAKNDCDSVAFVGDTLSTIIIQLQQENNSWRLQWESALPLLYTLSRKQPQPTVLLSGSPLTDYTDPIPVMIDEASLNFCYGVEGVATAGAVSRSQVCADYTPTVMMPDAVDPLNTTVNPQTGRARRQFGPVINVNEQTYNYRLIILNRNGAVVADINKTTADNSLDKSWDGRLRDGQPAPEEVYTYHLSVEFNSGYRHTMRGAVTVMYSK